MSSHGGGDSGVVDLNALHIVIGNNLTPKVNCVRMVGEDSQRIQKTIQGVIGLSGR